MINYRLFEFFKAAVMSLSFLCPRNAQSSESGQGATEVLLVLGLVALVAFPAVRFYGGGLRCGYFGERAQLESADTEVERCNGEEADSAAGASGGEDDSDFAADQPPLPEVPEMPPPPIRPDPGPNCKPAGTQCGALDFAYAPLGGFVSAPVPEECVTTPRVAVASSSLRTALQAPRNLKAPTF